MTKQPYTKKVIALDLSGSFTKKINNADSSLAKPVIAAINTLLGGGSEGIAIDIDIDVISWGDSASVGVYNYSKKTSRVVREQVSAAMRVGLNTVTEMAPLIDYYRNLLRKSGDTDLIIISDGDLMDKDLAEESLKALKSEFPTKRITYIGVLQPKVMPASYAYSSLHSLIKNVPDTVVLQTCDTEEIADVLKHAIYCPRTISKLYKDFDAANKMAKALGQEVENVNNLMRRRAEGNYCKPK